MGRAAWRRACSEGQRELTGLKTESLAKKYFTIVLVIVGVTFLSVQLIQFSFGRAGETGVPLGLPQDRTGVQRIMLDEPIRTLDPVFVSGPSERWISGMIHETLFVLDDQGVPRGALVQDVSESGGQVELLLDADRRFHSGRPVSAWDVKFSLERFVRLSSRHRLGQEQILAGLEGFSSYVAGDAQEISGIEVTGNRTLTLILTRPDPSLPERLALPQMAILEERQVTGQQPYGTLLSGQEVLPVNGTGPVRLAEWSYQALALERAFGGTERFPPRLEIMPAGSMEEVLMGLDMFYADAALFSGNPEGLLEGRPELVGRMVVHQTGHVVVLRLGAHLEGSLRRGLVLGLERHQLAAVRGDRPLHALGSVSGAQSPRRYEENAALAGVYLQEAGGRILRIGVSDSPGFQEMAQVLAESWSRWGIEAEVVVQGEPATLRSSLAVGTVDVILDRVETGPHLPFGGLHHLEGLADRQPDTGNGGESLPANGDFRQVPLVREQYRSLVPEGERLPEALEIWEDMLQRSIE